MTKPRLGLRQKMLVTHILVAAASAVVLLAALLLAWWVSAPRSLGGIEMLQALALVAISGLAGVAVAAVASRWLFEQVAVPVRRASSVARGLTKEGRVERSESALPGSDGGRFSSEEAASGDEVAELGASIDDLALSLEAAERRRMNSFGEVTHELRTPIAILEGYFEGLLDGHVEPSDKTWAMLYDVASRAHRLVDELQTLSRAESRQEPPDLQSVNPGIVARAALDRMRLHFDEKGLQLVEDIPEGLPLVLADPDHTVQVLVNLLTNALRYTPLPGKVSLSIAELGDAAEREFPAAAEVVFRVTDTGVGIAAEHIPHLFERFFRVDRQGSRGVDGSGIGLPVAKARVEAMGGRIWAQSPGIGEGSTFSFTLLIAPDPERA